MQTLFFIFRDINYSVNRVTSRSFYNYEIKREQIDSISFEFNFNIFISFYSLSKLALCATIGHPCAKLSPINARGIHPRRNHPRNFSREIQALFISPPPAGHFFPFFSLPDESLNLGNFPLWTSDRAILGRRWIVVIRSHCLWIEFFSLVVWYAGLIVDSPFIWNREGTWLQCTLENSLSLSARCPLRTHSLSLASRSTRDHETNRGTKEPRLEAHARFPPGTRVYRWLVGRKGPDCEEKIRRVLWKSIPVC